MTMGRVSRFDGDRWHRRGLEDAAGVPLPEVTALVPADDGVWVATSARGVWRLADGTWIDASDGLPGSPGDEVQPKGPVTALTSDDDGGLWAGLDRSGIAQADADVDPPDADRVVPNAWRIERPSAGLPAAVDARAVLIDGDTVWVGTLDDGVWHHEDEAEAHERDTWSSYGLDDGLPSSRVYTLARTDNGEVWAGTDAGPARFDGTAWSPVGPDGPADAVVHHLTAQAAALWAATDDGLWHRDGGTWTQHTTADGLPTDDVTAVAIDDDGQVWAGTDAGLAVLNGADGWQQPSHEAGLDQARITSVAVADATVWAATYDPVTHGAEVVALDPDDATTVSFAEDDGFVGTVGGLFVDDRSAVWAVDDRGPSRYRDGRLTHHLTPSRTNVGGRRRRGRRSVGRDAPRHRTDAHPAVGPAGPSDQRARAAPSTHGRGPYEGAQPRGGPRVQVYRQQRDAPTMHPDDRRGRFLAEPSRPDDTDSRDDDARRAPVSSTSPTDLHLPGRRPAGNVWRIGRRAFVVALVLLAAAACERQVAQPDEEEPDDRLVVGDGDPEALDELRSIAEQIAELRGLDFTEPVHLDVVTEEELVEVYRELRDEEADDPEYLELRDERQRALETLHMLPEGVDLDEAIETMVEVAVLGLFSPRTERAYAVSSDGELEPAVTATVAHELVHALQHQHTDLNRMEDIDEPDERFAFSSLVEGDAVTIEEAWVEAHLDDDAQEERDRTLGRIGMDAQEVLSDIPLYVLVKQGLPYEIGGPFVSRLLEEGGQQAVDDALEEPPRTSVEIYDPQLYLDGFEPRAAPSLDPPGTGWEQFHATTFGAWQVDFFSFTLGPGHAPIGSQWRGGALRAWTDPDDRVAAAFSVTFDGDAADSFCERLPIWYEAHAGASAEEGGVLQTERNVVVVDCDGQDVRLAAAPDVSLTNAVLDLE